MSENGRPAGPPRDPSPSRRRGDDASPQPPDRRVGPAPIAGDVARQPPISGRAAPMRVPATSGARRARQLRPSGAARTPLVPDIDEVEEFDASSPSPLQTSQIPAQADAGGSGGSGGSGATTASDDSILKTSGSIALATLTSRITGFVRTVLVLAMLGPAVASAFQAAYVLPSMIAEVVLGAVLTAIVIPVLARAEAEDDDGGKSFIDRIFTLTVVTLGLATVIALIAAPLLTYLNVGDGDVNRALTTALAYLLLPEILFYGLSALFIAILNMKGYFKPGAWAPVLNNIVQIATLVLYAAMPGEITLNPVRMTNPQLLVLGVGTTLGVVLQASVLVPWLRRAGVRLRLKWGIDARLRQFGNMALAIVFYVAVLQVGLVITYRIAAHAEASGISVYVTQWQLLQLPYGVLGVTILTAIMPRLSRNATADDTPAVVDDLSLATRLTMVALVPVVAFMTFFGPAISIAIFNFGKFDAAAAEQLGSVLAFGAFTIIPYAMTLVQLRVFYARQDPWTPTFIAIGVTVVKVASSYLGQAVFDDPSMVIRWLALSNGLGYLVGAIVGHYLLRNRLGNARLHNVTRTTIVTIGVSVVVTAAVWLLAHVSGLHRLATDYGKIGSLIYLILVGVVSLGVTYAGLAVCKVPDVVAIGDAVRRLLGRFIPALAPAPVPETGESKATITVQFPRVTAEESLPYSGHVQVLRRFDRGSATWQSYSVHSGGAAGLPDERVGPRPVPRDIRYRRRGVRRVSDSEVGATQDHTETLSIEDSAMSETAVSAADTVSAPDTGGATPTSDGAPAPPAVDPGSPNIQQVGPGAPIRRPRGPRLVPGAAVAGGRYRLLDHHGGTRGLQFWRALDVNLDREVALTFVDAEQLAPPPKRGEEAKPSDSGPQAVLSRTLRLGQVQSAGVARVLDVVRGSSGGIVVSEWTPGSPLSEVARSQPSPIGAARAVRALAAAAEAAHRYSGALSIDHPDRIRISTEGNAVLAFPGTLAGDDKSSDVRGLGAVLYALLLARWPLDAETGSTVVTTRDVTEPVGGLQIADPDDKGQPVEPRAARPDTPFEISAVASRALDGGRGIRTAATVQHVLDQATVVDLNTDMLPAIDGERPPAARFPTAPEPTEAENKRNMALLIGAGLFILFVVIALVVWISGAFGGGNSSTDINSILTTSSAAPGAPAGAAPIPLQNVSLVDFSNQPPDSSVNLANVISGTPPPWRTDQYRTSPDFGGLKSGLGLMFNLGGTKSVSSVTIQSPTPGFNVSIRTSPSATPTLAQTREVAAGTVAQPNTTIPVANPQASPFVMVYITTLPANPNGGYQAQIAQISMNGN